VGEDRDFTSASFYQFLAEKKLMASRCKKCHALYLPPHPICTKCHAREMEWVEMKGSGKLAAFTSIAVGPSFTIDEGHDRNNPYVVGIVKLDEGPKISGRIRGLDATRPASIEVGTPLAAEFPEHAEGGCPYVTFTTK